MYSLTFFVSLFIVIASTEARLGSIKNGSCQNTMGVNPCGPGSACHIVDDSHYECEKQEIVEASVEEAVTVPEQEVVLCDQDFNPCGPDSLCDDTDRGYICRPIDADVSQYAITR